MALNRAEECGTCDGLGVMEVLDKVEPPDGLEVYEPVVCAECLGTGRGVVAKLLADARNGNLETT